MTSFYSLKESVTQTILELYRMGFVLELEGNVSAKAEVQNNFAITPSQLPRNIIQPEDILIVNYSGKVLEGHRKPSIETGMHSLIYTKRPDVGAILHFHSPYATAMASLHLTLPPFLEELVPFLGEDVPTVPYAMAGTEELGLNVASGLLERNAVLLANHGAIVCGKSLEDAMWKAKILEKAATIFILAKSVGRPSYLPEGAIKAGMDVFKNRH